MREIPKSEVHHWWPEAVSKFWVLGQLSYRLVTLDGGKRHLCLEGRCVVPACSSAHGRS